MLSRMSLLALGFVIVNGARASEYGRICGQDTLSKSTICYRYWPSRALEVTTSGKRTEYTVSKENARVKYEGATIVDTYDYEPAIADRKVVLKSRVVEPARYPGDGEYETLTLEGTTPDGVKFLVKKPK